MADNGRKLASRVEQMQELNRRIDADETLTEEEKEAIRAKARQHVAKQRKKKLEEDFLDQAIEEEELRYKPTEQLEGVILHLPDFSNNIRLDGKIFFHGLHYTVTYNVARVMYDIMARMWEHQNEIEGKPRRSDLQRRHANNYLSPAHQSMSVGSPGDSGLNRMTTRRLEQT